MYRIFAVEEPAESAKRWSIVVDGERVYGPEHLYDCIHWRDRRPVTHPRRALPSDGRANSRAHPTLHEPHKQALDVCAGRAGGQAVQRTSCCA